MPTLEELVDDLKRLLIDNPFGYTVTVTVVYRRLPEVAPFVLFLWSLYRWGSERQSGQT